MPYNYEAASTTSSTSPSRGRACFRSGPFVAATEDGSVSDTGELWAMVRSSTAWKTGSPSFRSVRFADEAAPSCHSSPRRAGSPASQTSSVPSLSHSVDSEHDDDIKSPSTPEFKPLKSCLSKRRSESRKPESHKSDSLPPAYVAAYSTIAQIAHEFDLYVIAFQRPRKLDFETPTAGLNEVPALLFTARNQPLLEHVRNLKSLQIELGGVKSYDDYWILKARTEADLKIQNELDGLKRMRARIWTEVHTIF
ncbi:hypothetical protein FRC10_011347 [Ceratobasidium sp. 414]|nr:hypothetical protein FRC10_011347 [Ceratobasidium sp. 414]